MRFDYPENLKADKWKRMIDGADLNAYFRTQIPKLLENLEKHHHSLIRSYGQMLVFLTH